MPTPPPSNLDEHARALGHVCIAWGQLELHLDLLLKDLMFANPPGPAIGDKWTAAQCVTANTDMRDKIQIAMALGYLRRPSEEWFDKLQQCLNRINNSLRNDRNRMLHDVWMAHHTVPGGFDGVIRRRIQGTKIRKPQAFIRELVTSEVVTVAAEEIWKLRDEIRDANTLLTILWGNFLHPGFFPWP